MVVGHDTADNVAFGGRGTGYVASDHAEPSQRSMVGGLEPWPLSPTAKQLVGLEHATPLSSVPTGSGLGPGLTAQLAPFQRSMVDGLEALLP